MSNQNFRTLGNRIDPSERSENVELDEVSSSTVRQKHEHGHPSEKYSQVARCLVIRYSSKIKDTFSYPQGAIPRELSSRSYPQRAIPRELSPGSYPQGAIPRELSQGAIPKELSQGAIPGSFFQEALPGSYPQRAIPRELSQGAIPRELFPGSYPQPF